MFDTGRAAQGTEMRPSPSTAAPDDLPYVIEIWGESLPQNVERILARAANIKLARAILKSAEQEYPARRITLRTGDRVIEDIDANAQEQSAPQVDNAH